MKRRTGNKTHVWVLVPDLFVYEVITDIVDKPIQTFKMIDGKKTLIDEQLMSLQRIEVTAECPVKAIENVQEILRSDWGHNPSDYNVIEVNKLRQAIDTKLKSRVTEDDIVVDFEEHHKNSR